jgi:hypothetical protein
MGSLALICEPMAREYVKEMRDTLGPRYINAIWAQRAFEQEARNEAAMSRWRASYPAWDRLFKRPAMDLHARIANVIGMAAARPEDSKAA